MEYNDIFEREQISEDLLRYSDGEGNSEEIKIRFIKTRSGALKICEEKTKIALKKDNAYYRLDEFCNDFMRVRNYEIENYLERISGEFGWKIIGLCPFNAFNGLDNKYDYSKKG